MLLTVSKRLEFSASRRLHVSGWREAKNLAVFGTETNARYGTGRNYVAYFVFTGPVDQSNGMLINISEIKARAGRIVRERFDHKFLNQDNPSFHRVPPTAVNVARQLYLDVAPLFQDALKFEDESAHLEIGFTTPRLGVGRFGVRSAQ